MSPSDTRNGGEIRGSRLTSDRIRLPGRVVRVTAQARTSATATVSVVETADATRLLIRMRKSRHVPKNATYWPRPTPSAVVTLAATTRTTGQTTKTSRSASTVAAV